MIRRPEGAEFAPGAYVFPGGSVHAEDSSFSDSIKAAALRELFEEVGILLARRSGRLAGQADADDLRGRLREGAGWSLALAAAGLEPAFERLVTLARWVTPEPLRRRFDTRFYLARQPTGQAIEPQPGEVASWAWVRPATALEDPEFTLVYATRQILISIAGEANLNRLIARLRRRRRLEVVRPRLVETQSGWEVVH
jgi:8-oxo-dGTP pyrophosphatase MutT (NUDIX family)